MNAIMQQPGGRQLTAYASSSGTVHVETVHSTGEVMYVAAGSGELRKRGEPIAFRQGDAIFIPAGEWHSLANTGVGDLVSVFSFPYPGRPVSESRPVGTGEA